MIIDNLIVNALTKEFCKKLIGSRISKVNQIDSYNFLFETWDKKSKDLIVSLHPNSYRACITYNKYAYLRTPTPFLSQLKKFLEGSYILEIEQLNFDRIIKIKFEGIDSVKDKFIFFVFLELTGKYSNLILTDEKELVLCAYKYVDERRNEERQILLEKPYCPITNKFEKISPQSITLEKYNEIFESKKNSKINKFLTENFLGLSTHTCNLILEDSLKDKYIRDLNEQEKTLLFKIITNFYLALKNNDLFIEFTEKNNKLDFYIINEENYEISEIIEDYFYTLDQKNRLHVLKTELNIIVDRNIVRITKKLTDNELKLKEAGNADIYREYSDLIYSNLYSLPEKASSIELENYYDNNNLITIELDNDLTITDNAKKFLKKYNKLKNTLIAINNINKENQQELDYFENVSIFIENAETPADLKEIKQELENEKYIAKKVELKNKKFKPEKPNFLTFTTDDGFEVLVGKNNTQNDFLTTKFASVNDFWFHTRLIPGSHVILRTENGQKKVTQEAIIFASKLAAKYSKAKNSSNVCIIYTKIKNVKKIPHAKIGLVNYVNEKAIFVTPS